MDRLCDSTRKLLRDHPPDEALAEWLDRFVSYAAAKRGMKGVLLLGLLMDGLRHRD